MREVLIPISSPASGRSSRNSGGDVRGTGDCDSPTLGAFTLNLWEGEDEGYAISSDLLKDGSEELGAELGRVERGDGDGLVFLPPLEPISPLRFDGTVLERVHGDC